ncbi:unnamed protein product [Brachionus calyciflorus]|uniref:Uncharacterized protein n=1 Tax=Brachionus calyciflorus TaxID=104777 RepID=A0A814KBA2_9BILA|nr:unnamed protein product [Brachionus calyciflorus]
MKPPKTLKQLQKFFGLCNYYRKCQEAFELLKGKLVEYPILRKIDFNREFIVYTDASTTAISVILAQNDENCNEYVVFYASRLLKNHERNYSITELECLAVIWGVNHFRIYLYYRKVLIVTDHYALKWLLTLKSPNARLTRWAILLQTFNFEISHRKGKIHSNVDALSRPVLLLKESKVEDEIEDISTKNFGSLPRPAFKIKRRFTSAYNPRANGLTERFNQTLVSALRKQAADDPQNGDRYLPLVLMAYRNRIHSSTNYTPFEVLFGRKMNGFDRWEFNYPRWRLKVGKPEKVIEKPPNENNLSKEGYEEIEKILDHKKVGRGFKYLVKWKNKPVSGNRWIKGSDFYDKIVLDEYHNSTKNSTKTKRNKLNVNFVLSLLFFFYFICLTKCQKINAKSTYCQHNDNNRVVNLNYVCKQNKVLNKIEKKKENYIWILSKQDLVINDYGFQCYKKKYIRQMNASILFTQSESIRHEIVKLSRIECLAMVESKACDNKKMNGDDIGCIYSE